MDTKTSIKKEARTLFADIGYEGFSMGQLATACNKNKATLYHYYKSKQELYNEIVTEELTAFQKAIGSNTLPVLEALMQIKAYIETLLSMDIKSVKILEQLLTQEQAALFEETRLHLQAIPKSFEAIYKTGIGAGDFKILQPQVLFHLIMGGIFHYRLSPFLNKYPHFGQELFDHIASIIREK